MPFKVALDLIGPAQDAAQIVQAGVAKAFQLAHGIGTAAAGAAVDQPYSVLIRQHLSRTAQHLTQRQQLCAGDVAHGKLVRLPDIYSSRLVCIQQTDGIGSRDLLTHTLTPYNILLSIL